MALENVMAVDNGKILGLHSETAANVPYDNSNSGLTADNVQEAVDELNSSLNDRIITEKYSFTKSVGPDSSIVEYTANKPGYKALLHFLAYADPAQLVGNFQYIGYDLGSFYGGGYFKTLNGLTINKDFDLYVLWLKL